MELYCSQILEADMGTVTESVLPESEYRLVQVRTPFVCLLHWIIVLSVVTLCLTGLYIGSPSLLTGKGEAYATFAMAKVRFFHFLAANGLIISFLLRLYHSFSPSTRRDIMEIMPTPSNVKAALKLAYFYITGKGEHYHYRYINPLGGLSVFAVVFLSSVLIATGFTLYAQQANAITWWWMAWFPSLIERVFYGMSNVRFVHHLTMYVLLSVVVIHVYMKVYVDIAYKEADIASIISGYKVFHKDAIAKYEARYAGRS
jgi:Ni/Fe-hydrogenase 1 B-type cytochrome subunit